MDNISALQDYLKKIQRAVDNTGLTIMNYKFVKKSRIDDLLVCMLALMPESYINIMNKKTQQEMFPSITYFNQLNKVIKRTFFLTPDYYMVNFIEVSNLLKALKQNMESDIRILEEQL